MATENILYEANTVSKISCGSKKGRFAALAPSSSKLCVVSGDLVQITSLHSHSEPNVFKLECLVDCVGWSGDESLLVVGDRQGVLHFISPALHQVLFSQDVTADSLLVYESTEVGIAVESPTRDQVFTSIEFSGSKEVDVTTLCVLCFSGQVLLFKNLCLNRIRQVLEQNDLQLIKQFKDDITLTKVDISSEHGIFSSFLLPLATPTPFSNADFITTGSGRSGLCVWGGNETQDLEVLDSVSYLLRGVCVQRCGVTEDSKYLITLTDTGSLAVWHFLSLVMVNVWTCGGVRDFSLCGVTVASPGTREARDCSDRACVLTQDAMEKTTLTLASLPGLHALYTLDIQSEVGLVHGRATEDSLYFTELEGDTVLVKHLTQALPEKRLATLLALEKFDEAEELARKFNLDAELVYQTKTRVLNSLWINKTLAGEETADVHANLLQCVEHVQDSVFIGELILSSHYPTLDMTLDTLCLAKNKLKQSSGKDSRVKASKLKVLTALNKLVTFQMLHPEDKFSSEKWFGFITGSLLDYLKAYFQSGNLKKIAIIWSRHIGDLVSKLNGDELISLLRSLPELVVSSELGLWVSHSVVPFILQHTPQCMNHFLEWVQRRVRLLELSEKEQWPRNGLQLCDIVLECLSSFRNPMKKLALQTSSFSLQDSTNEYHLALSGLKNLQQSLRDICYLQTSLQCSLTLSEHEKENREVVVYRLLDQAVAAELVSATIQHKVAPYVKRHALNLDAVLLDYIKLFLSQSPRLSTGLSDSPYEAKAIALVQALTDKELYVSGCIEVLKYVYTPWSEAVEELVQCCMKVDHPHVAMLEKQYQLLQLKKLLHGYGIKNVNFTDPTLSYRWLYIHRILSTERSTVLEDALKVANMYDLSATVVYKVHIMNLGMKGKIIEASEALRSLPKDERIATAQSLFECTSSKLKLSFNPDLDNPEEYKMAAKIALLCLFSLKEAVIVQEICILDEDWINIDSAISLYERLLSLQVEFSTVLSPEVLMDRDACYNLFQKKVIKFSSDLCKAKEETGGKSTHQASRYAHLLGFTEKQFCEAVALTCARNKNLEQAKAICWELLGVDSENCSAPLLLYTVQQWWALIKSKPGCIGRRETKELRDLASQAVLLSDKSLLLPATEVYSACALLCVLHSQCEVSGTDTDDELSLENSKSLMSAYFKEDGLVLDQQEVLLAAVQCAEARAPSLTIDNVQYPTAHLSGGTRDISSAMEKSSALSQMLKDNGHLQLVALCTMQSLSAYCHHAGVLELLPQAVLEEGQRELSSLLVGLTGKVLSSRKLDHDYGLNLLLMLPPTLAAQKLQGIKMRSISSYSRVISLCNLAINYGHISGQSQLSDLAMSIRSSAEWGKRLSRVKVSFTEAFRGGMEEKKAVAEVLFRNKMVDIDTVQQYCSEVLGNKPQSVLLAYLRVVLMEWEEPQEALERANMILSIIHNRQHVQELLASLLSSKVSPYDYERVSFILTHLVNEEQAFSLKAEQGLLLLDCLKYYTRQSSPSEFERNWYSTNRLQLAYSPEHSISEVQLPALSSERLPFHYLLYATPMDVIGQELSLSTITKLVPIAKILKLEGDEFYSVAIKNIASDNHVLSKNDTSKNKFDSVLELLGCIKNTNLALSITKWLAKQLSTDEERVEALKTAVSIAQRWKEQARTEKDQSQANEKLQMFTKLLRVTQTDQLLHQYKLDNLLDLSVQGATLIIKLFTDLPVAKPQPGQTLPDVHTLASEIAQIHHVSLDKIKTKLTETWLTSMKAESRDMDVTQMSMMEDPTENAEEESEDELNLKRLKYLLNVSDKLESNILMLLHWAKHNSSNALPVGNLSRVKALQVLFAIAPDHLIEKISGASVSDLREYMQSAVFTSELEQLHMSTTVPAFVACNKEGLVKSLWRNHSQEPRALRLIGELCLHYSVGDSALWSKLLQALLNLGMVPYLRHVLRALLSYPEQLLEIQILPSMWQDILLVPFQDASSPLSPFQQDECTESLHLLLGCPFLMEVDIGRIAEAFSDVGLLGHALAATLVIPKEQDKEPAIRAMLNKLNQKSLVKVLDELGNYPELTGLVSEIEEVIYLFVNTSGRHQELLGTQHFAPYVHFLVARKMIDGLLSKTIEANKIPEAIQLVELYNQHHSQLDLSGPELLKDYVEANDLFELKNTLNLLAS